jgi:hypothetical protein
MREIKFRAWDKSSSEMRDWDFYTGIPYTLNDFFDNDKELIPMQCTGLKDKNGKEIYDGDIYKQKWSGQVIIGKIVYGDMARYWLEPCESYYIGVIKITGEIIGNIYENPELVEGKANV